MQELVRILAPFLLVNDPRLISSLKVLTNMVRYIVGQNVVLYTDYYKIVQSKIHTPVNLTSIVAQLKTLDPKYPLKANDGVLVLNFVKFLFAIVHNEK